MATIFDARARARILERFAELTPDQRPVWGRFTAPEMVCHVSCGLGQGLGEYDAGPPNGPLRYPPLNWLLIHVLPWPKGKAKSPRSSSPSVRRNGRRTWKGCAHWSSGSQTAARTRAGLQARCSVDCRAGAGGCFNSNTSIITCDSLASDRCAPDTSSLFAAPCFQKETW